ncbi:oligopeptide ABC transporter permease [Ethanoligenens harbinense]|uniref:oligopeptide ABC transporter permease n=1 Tax=Ethanoligenens harbinense TaxID=253239 RepID=UPI001FAAFEE4|nr:oligopeptide ABC transporter permease [Ethanoligenens harbinense]
MNKKRLMVTVSLAGLILSLVSFFLPFITIANYRPVPGVSLIFGVFQRIQIPGANSDAMEKLSIYSYSLPALLTFILFALSIVFLALYLKQKRLFWLHAGMAGTIVGFLLYGVQLSNSNTLVSDFFGLLAQASQGSGSNVVYTIPDVENVCTGMGARLLVVFGLVAMFGVLLAKFFQHEEKSRTERLDTPLNIAYRQFKRNKLALLGMGVIIVLLMACFYGPVFSNFALLQTNIDIAKEQPGFPYLLGTDSVGRDVLTRILYGGRISMEVGFVTVLVEIVIGVLVGGVAGYYGKWVDNILMRILDIFLSLPLIPVVIIFGAVMMDLKVDPAKRIYVVMLVLGLFFWPSLGRLVRGQILSLREQEYMVAAEALGIRDSHRIFRHLVPNALPNIIVTATLDVGNAILTESMLSFLGLGVAMPYPSWGNIITAVQDPNDFAMRPWLWVPAGICILVTVLAINLMGDGLRDAFDPKMKR